MLGDAIGTRVLTFSLSTANEEVLTAEGPDSSPSSLHSLLSSKEKSALLSSDALSSSLPSDSDSDSDTDSERDPATTALQKARRHVRGTLSPTHSGVAQFTAAEGTIGLPYLTAKR